MHWYSWYILSQATRLKKEQEALLVQQWELEKIEEERKKMEERQEKAEMRYGRLPLQITNHKYCHT